jgi:hypothetical protein
MYRGEHQALEGGLRMNLVRNLGTPERIVRAVAGAGFLIWGLLVSTSWKFLLFALGLGLLANAAVGY